MAIVPYVQPIDPDHIPDQICKAFGQQPNDKISCVTWCIAKLRAINPLLGIGYRESFSTEGTLKPMTLWNWDLLVIGDAPSHLQMIEALFAKNRFISNPWELAIESISSQGQIILGFIPFNPLIERHKKHPASPPEF